MMRVQTMIIAIAATTLTAAVCLAGPQSAHNSAAPDVSVSKKAEEQYKNIQVLKGLPADQVVPGMQFISASLGVECQFCHVQDAFDKDDKKPKLIARKMMTMMFAINKDNFDGHREVTCFSCHRGSADPLSTPPVMAEDLKPLMNATAAAEKSEHAQEKDAPSPDQLFDKYLQAVGGTAAVEKITSRVMKGTITFGDRSVPIDIYCKDPEKRISFTHTPDGDSITAFDGHEGWLGIPARPPRDMHGQELDAAAMDADLRFAAHLKGMFNQAEVRGSEKVGDADAYLVVGRREGKPPLRLYFDKNSGLLVRLVRYADTPFGLLPTEIDYADYRQADDVKIPFRWTLARTSGRFTIQVAELKQNVPVDDAKFIKPAAPPQQQPAK
jgi:photosynthetic reaction center cytochrome c subunit